MDNTPYAAYLRAYALVRSGTALTTSDFVDRAAHRVVSDETYAALAMGTQEAKAGHLVIGRRDFDARLRDLLAASS